MKTPKLDAEIVYKVIEVDREISAADWSKEDEEALRTLRGQPGYLALLKKIRLHRSFMRTALESQRFDNVQDFAATQAWSQALRWLQGLVKEAAAEKPQSPRSLYQLEEDSFAEIAKAIKLVG